MGKPEGKKSPTAAAALREGWTVIKLPFIRILLSLWTEKYSSFLLCLFVNQNGHARKLRFWSTTCEEKLE